MKNLQAFDGPTLCTWRHCGQASSATVSVLSLKYNHRSCWVWFSLSFFFRIFACCCCCCCCCMAWFSHYCHCNNYLAKTLAAQAGLDLPFALDRLPLQTRVNSLGIVDIVITITIITITIIIIMFAITFILIFPVSWDCVRSVKIPSTEVIFLQVTELFFFCVTPHSNKHDLLISFKGWLPHYHHNHLIFHVGLPTVYTIDYIIIYYIYIIYYIIYYIYYIYYITMIKITWYSMWACQLLTLSCWVVSPG